MLSLAARYISEPVISQGTKRFCSSMPSGALKQSCWEKASKMIFDVPLYKNKVFSAKQIPTTPSVKTASQAQKHLYLVKKGGPLHQVVWHRSLGNKFEETKQILDSQTIDMQNLDKDGYTALDLVIRSATNKSCVGDLVELFLNNYATIDNNRYINGSVLHTLIETYHDESYDKIFVSQLCKAIKLISEVSDIKQLDKHGMSICFFTLKVLKDEKVKEAVIEQLAASGAKILKTEEAYLKIVKHQISL